MKQEYIELGEADTNKQIRLYSPDGKYVRHSVDEVIANNMNQWQGWKCSAGVKGLYIDFDGNLWVCNTASSMSYLVPGGNRFNYEGWDKLEAEEKAKTDPDKWQERRSEIALEYRTHDKAYKKIFPIKNAIQAPPPGVLGNIFDGFTLPREDFTCAWKSCGCGADVFLSKAKDEKSKELLAVTNDGYDGQFKTKGNLVNILTEDHTAMEVNFEMPYQILWDLGRRCNYDCSYCWRSVHNRDAEHKPLDVMIRTADKIIHEWAQHEQIRWNFGGGEPTLNPDFLPFIQHLKKKGQHVLVTTNGSRPAKYWKEAMHSINSVNLSVHFEFADDRKVFKNIETICNHFDENDGDYWLEIKLMTPPQFFDRSLALRNEILTNTTITTPGKNGRMKGTVSIVPIRSMGDSGALVEYSEEQLEILRHQ